MVVITVLYWAWTARLVFGETLALRRRAFVEAAVAAGVPGRTIVRGHILPHLAPLLLTLGALNAASVVSIGAARSSRPQAARGRRVAMQQATQPRRPSRVRRRMATLPKVAA